MKINPTENIELHDKLFKNWDNYEKWAPFLIEFQQQYNSKCKGVPAVLGPTFLCVNDELKDEFLAWINTKINKER